ncbi:MAG: CidA/LrgA family protein, partial [Sphaerochaetaceae bacterium]|nr:CidA/LrgA family protein [Sphaerochaetaceae bacterium]
VILAVSFLGEIMSYLIPLPVPASVYGMVLMFIFLKTKIIALSQVKETGKFLIEIMGLMFVPSVVGVMVCKDEILSSIPLYICVLASTAIVMAVSALVTQALSKKGREK